MHRRSVLKGALLAALQPLLWSLPTAGTAKTTALARRVRPSDPAWPDAASWAKLKDSVGGNLREVHSLFASCGAEPNGADCLAALQNIHNPYYIGDQAGGTQVSGWFGAWTPAPSAYAVTARNARDVAAAVNFARENNLRLVVKGGGHSYQGTSNAPDSLLIWTREMNTVTLHDAFVGKGCEGKLEPLPAVTIEAGAMWIDAYDAVTTQAGRYVQGGGCANVGVAGLVQSGGFGSYSKGFGTAAGGLLEAEIVTADGVIRTVNACSDADLFWALKGGGGGSWGVVTKLTLRTYELPEHFGFVGGKVRAKSDAAFHQLISRFIEFYGASLCNPHWGEQVRLGPGNALELSMVCQGLDNDQAASTWQPFFDWIKGSTDFAAFDLEAGAGHSRHNWDVVYRKSKNNDSMISDPRPGAPKHHAWWSGDGEQVGAFIHGYDSIWLPATLLQPAAQKSMADALFAASRFKTVGLHFNKGLAGAGADALARTKDTATNPAVLDAFALVIIADGEGAAYPGLARPAVEPAVARANAGKIDLAMAELRRLAPDGGSYVSESNYFNPAWQSAYWGPNYGRLRAIKKKYDPAGLFFVHNGVDSERWSTDGFIRIS